MPTKRPFITNFIYDANQTTVYKKLYLTLTKWAFITFFSDTTRSSFYITSFYITSLYITSFYITVYNSLQQSHWYWNKKKSILMIISEYLKFVSSAFCNVIRNVIKTIVIPSHKSFNNSKLHLIQLVHIWEQKFDPKQ